MIVLAQSVSTETIVVPLVVVVAIILGSIKASGWFKDQFSDVKTEIAALKTEIGQMKNDAKSSACRIEIELWIEKIRGQNPDLHVPDLPQATSA